MNSHKFLCLGISGQKQSGKDTFASIIHSQIEENLGCSFKRVAFADPLKNILSLFQYQDEEGVFKKVDRDFIETNKEKYDYIPKTWNMTIRESMCHLGDSFRKIQPNIWINMAMLSNTHNKIVTDVRYENEMEWVKNNTRSIIIRIIRENNESQKIDLESETSLLKHDKKVYEFEGEIKDKSIPYDYVLKNDSNIDNYKNKIINKVLPFILKKWKFLL